MKKQLLSFCLLLLIPAWVFAQWGNNPNNVLSISGQEATSFVLNTKCDSRGNTIAVYYDNDFKLQFQVLDTNGVRQFNPPILVSAQPQLSYVGEIELLVDKDDNVYIAHTDARYENELNVVMYKLDMEGNFLWPKDGLVITQDKKSNEGPILKEDEDSSLILVYNVLEDPDYDNSYFVLNRIFSDGTFMAEGEVYKEEGQNLGFPSLFFNVDETITMIYAASTGSGGLGAIHMQKFNPDLEALFTQAVNVSKYPGALAITYQEVILDSNGNYWIAWFDDSGGSFKFDVKIQKVTADGDLLFGDEPKLIAVAPDSLAINPRIIDFTSDGNLLIDYMLESGNQSTRGVYRQLLDDNGERQWGNKGRLIIPPNDFLQPDLVVQEGPDKSLVLFALYDNSLLDKKKLMVLGVDYEANLLWKQTPIVLSDSAKIIDSRMINGPLNDQWIITWTDDHLVEERAYAQNLTLDGKTGTPVGINENVNSFIGYTILSNHILFEEEFQTAEVYDYLGRLLLLPEKDSREINMSTIPYGIYMVRVWMKDGQTRMIKCMIGSFY